MVLNAYASTVMAALDPAIHVTQPASRTGISHPQPITVDGRVEPGHDEAAGHAGPSRQLQSSRIYGIICHMAPATLFYRDKGLLPDGGIIEITIWRLPQADPERPHGLKYSLYYGKAGQRLVGYDNERGKGDHRHYLGREENYEFVSPEALISDFMADVRKVRSET